MQLGTKRQARIGSSVQHRQVARCNWGILGTIAVVLMLPLHVGALGSGDLDLSFSVDGRTTTSFSSGREMAAAVAIQADGKIVVAGTSNGDFALARYTTTGALDSSFSGDGRVTTNFSGSSRETVAAVAIQADGKIVVAGTSNGDFALARYTTTGALDSSFSGDGRVTTGFGSGSIDMASAVVIQADGKIIVAGHSTQTPTFEFDSDFALVRYLPNGTLDSSFGVGGRVLTNVGVFEEAYPSSDVATAMALQADGKIVVVGYSLVDGFYGAMVRYLPNGRLDPSFGHDPSLSDGIQIFCLEIDCNENFPTAVAIQGNGRIVVTVDVTTRCDVECIASFALGRFLPDGSPDTQFGPAGNGMVFTNFSPSDLAVAFALALQVDGKIIVAGISDANGTDDFALARYNTNGTLDPSFGGDGRVLTTFASGSNDSARTLVIQPRDGRIVAAGSSTATGGGDFALARYHAHTCNGVVVTQIGTNGSDSLTGTSGSDVIFAFGGNDVVNGLSGNDIICGGSGNDALVGGNGNDFLRGDAGTDRCDGGPGTDTAACETNVNVP